MHNTIECSNGTIPKSLRTLVHICSRGTERSALYHINYKAYVAYLNRVVRHHVKGIRFGTFWLYRCHCLTCVMSSKQLKMYLRASLDLMLVSASCSSGVCNTWNGIMGTQFHHYKNKTETYNTQILSWNFCYLRTWGQCIERYYISWLSLGFTIATLNSWNLSLFNKEDFKPLIVTM